ncbi:MAG: hypothetical protein QOJ19_2315, partial [Acidimicrobiia bacterium]|nr:hypothetical protein [Acidimicrobiia bacterium]
MQRATVGAMEGIDVAGVTTWYEKHVSGAKPPLHFDRLP